MNRFSRTAFLAAVVVKQFLAPAAQAQDMAPSLPEHTHVQESEPVRDAPRSRPSPVGGSMGGGGPGGIVGDGGGPPGYAAVWYPSRAVRDQNADLGFVRQGLNLGVPVWHDGGDMVMARLGVRNTLFSTDAILPDSMRPFPDQLWNLNFGLNYMHRFENGWTGMLMGGFGSASDKPFHSIQEMTANLGVMVQMPAHNGRDSWLLGAMYMAGGPVNFPLPILTYVWNPTDRLRVNVGVPLSLYWHPTDDWSLTLSYMPLLNINTRLTYRVAPCVQVYGGYEYLNESYFLADRVNIQDRFFVLEQRLVAGVRWEVGQSGIIEMNGGYSFGRFYGEGESPWSSLRDRVDVGPGPFLGVNFRLRF